jgi:hypothetical protein
MATLRIHSRHPVDITMTRGLAKTTVQFHGRGSAEWRWETAPRQETAARQRTSPLGTSPQKLQERAARFGATGRKCPDREREWGFRQDSARLDRELEGFTSQDPARYRARLDRELEGFTSQDPARYRERLDRELEEFMSERDRRTSGHDCRTSDSDGD